MRYLRDQAFYFVHIPKNGGQSVRNAMMRVAPLCFAPLATDLKVSEEEAARAAEHGWDDQKLGRIHPAHLPLWVLRDSFPASWQAFTNSRSIALTREPRDRFLSALMQRLKEFGGAGAIRAEDLMVAAEAKRVCDWLSGRQKHANLEYVHFIRQIDFTDLDGERRVNAIFPMNGAAAAAAWLSAQGGPTLEIGHDHARRQPKPWARILQPAARFAGRTLLPRQAKRALHPLWMKSGVFANAASEYGAVNLGADVEGFIKDYYAKDIALHDEAKARVVT